MVIVKPLPATLVVICAVLEAFTALLQVVPGIGEVASSWIAMSLLAVTAVVDALAVVAPAATMKWPDAALPKAAGEELEIPIVAVPYELLTVDVDTTKF